VPPGGINYLPTYTIIHQSACPLFNSCHLSGIMLSQRILCKDPVDNASIHRNGYTYLLKSKRTILTNCDPSHPFSHYQINHLAEGDTGQQYSFKQSKTPYSHQTGSNDSENGLRLDYCLSILPPQLWMEFSVPASQSVWLHT